MLSVTAPFLVHLASGALRRGDAAAAFNVFDLLNTDELGLLESPDFIARGLYRRLDRGSGVHTRLPTGWSDPANPASPGIAPTAEHVPFVQ